MNWLPGNRRRLAALSEEFGRRLGGRWPDPVTGSLIGLEHEYLVRRHSDGRRVNFAQLVHRLAPSQARLEPANPGAYWLPSGTILSADETEAELALPPTATRPGFAGWLSHRVAEAQNWLAASLPSDFYLGEGVSTHLSVSAPDDLLDRVCEAYARSWAAALMLLLDDRSSPGVLIRPRPGRAELCGEFARGTDLHAAALFALGSVLACFAGVKAGASPLSPLRLAVRHADQRFGWFVERGSGGSDLYVDGRRALLMTVDGRIRTAGEHLEAAWLLARPHLASHAGRTDLELVDRLVDGRLPLRVERTPNVATDEPAGTDLTSGHMDQNAYGRALLARYRKDFDMAPVMLTWHLAVFVIAAHDSGRRAFAAVPGRVLGRFLRRLDGGLLDGPITGYLRLRSARRVLANPAQASRAGLFDAILMRPALLPAERSVVNPGAAA